MTKTKISSNSSRSLSHLKNINKAKLIAPFLACSINSHAVTTWQDTSDVVEWANGYSTVLQTFSLEATASQGVMASGGGGGLLTANELSALDLNFDGLSVNGSAPVDIGASIQNLSIGPGQINIWTTEAYSAGDTLSFTFSFPTPYHSVSNLDPYFGATQTPESNLYAGIRLLGNVASITATNGARRGAAFSALTLDLFGLNTGLIGDELTVFDVATGAETPITLNQISPNHANYDLSSNIDGQGRTALWDDIAQADSYSGNWNINRVVWTYTLAEDIPTNSKFLFSFDSGVAIIPEPSSSLLGLLGIAFAMRRNRN